MLSDKRELMGKINQRYVDEGVQLVPAAAGGGSKVYCSIILNVETVGKLRDLEIFQNNSKTFDQIISDLIRNNRS